MFENYMKLVEIANKRRDEKNEIQDELNKIQEEICNIQHEIEKNKPPSFWREKNERTTSSGVML